MLGKRVALIAAPQLIASLCEDMRVMLRAVVAHASFVDVARLAAAALGSSACTVVVSA